MVLEFNFVINLKGLVIALTWIQLWSQVSNKYAQKKRNGHFKFKIDNNLQLRQSSRLPAQAFWHIFQNFYVNFENIQVNSSYRKWIKEDIWRPDYHTWVKSDLHTPPFYLFTIPTRVRNFFTLSSNTKCHLKLGKFSP